MCGVLHGKMHHIQYVPIRRTAGGKLLIHGKQRESEKLQRLGASRRRRKMAAQFCRSN